MSRITAQATTTTTTTESRSRWLLDIPEACRELHLCRAKLFQMLASGELGSIKVGKRRLIPVREIEAFIARQLESEGVI